MKKLLLLFFLFPCYAFAQIIPPVNDSTAIGTPGAAFTPSFRVVTYGGKTLVQYRIGTSAKWMTLSTTQYNRNYAAISGNNTLTGDNVFTKPVIINPGFGTTSSLDEGALRFDTAPYVTYYTANGITYSNGVGSLRLEPENIDGMDFTYTLKLPTNKNGTIALVEDIANTYAKKDSVSSKFFIDVRDYGYVADSTLDNSTPINNAIAAAKAGNIKVVRLPVGVIGISHTIYMPSNVTVEGNGIGLTRIKNLNSSTLDLITPLVQSGMSNYFKWKTMFATEKADAAFSSDSTTNVNIKDLTIDWNLQTQGVNSASPLMFGRTNNSHAIRIEIINAVPSDATTVKHYGHNMLFAFSKDCTLENSTITSSDYESVSSWYLSKRIGVYRNLLIADKPLTHINQTHLIQEARPSALITGLLAQYGESMPSQLYVEDNIFILKKNVGQAVTAHHSKGFYVRRNKFYVLPTMGAMYLVKPFSGTTDFDISGNIVDARGYSQNVYGSSFFTSNTSGLDTTVTNGKINNNTVLIKNPTAFTGTQTYPNSSIIGGYAAGGQNVEIANNLIEIDGYDDRSNPIIGGSGNGLNIHGNTVALKNPFVTITSSGPAAVKITGGDAVNITNNSIYGAIGNGIVADGTLFTLGKTNIALNNFPQMTGAYITTTNTSGTTVSPTSVDGVKADILTGNIPIDTAKFRTVANSLSLAQVQTKLNTKVDAGVIYNDAVNSRMGINTTAPLTSLHVKGDKVIIEHNSASGGFGAIRYTGTPNTYPASGNQIAEFAALGLGTLGIVNSRRFSLRVTTALNNWSATDNGTRGIITVTPNGGIVQKNTVVFENDGSLVVADGADTVSKVAGNSAKVIIKGSTSDATKNAVEIHNNNKKPLFAIRNDGAISITGYTVSTLPTSVQRGTFTFVTDALTPTFLGVVVGGGSVVAPVFYNGTNWVSY